MEIFPEYFLIFFNSSINCFNGYFFKTSSKNSFRNDSIRKFSLKTTNFSIRNSHFSFFRNSCNDSLRNFLQVLSQKLLKTKQKISKNCFWQIHPEHLAEILPAILLGFFKEILPGMPSKYFFSENFIRNSSKHSLHKNCSFFFRFFLKVFQ